MGINELIISIAQSLNAEFEDGYEIYSEMIEQGFEEPCFFIAVVSPHVESKLKGTHKKYNKFDIQFFPSEGLNVREEINTVYEKMWNVLEVISVGEKKIRGHNIQTIIEDNILHFFIEYNFFITESADENHMEKLLQNGGIKNV